MSKAQRIVQMGTQVTQGLGAGSQPDVGAAAAQEVIDEIRDHLAGANMVFVTAGMGGGTGTGAAAGHRQTARDMASHVGVVTKPFHFEGQRRMRTAESASPNFTGGRYAADHSEPNLFRCQRKDHLRDRSRWPTRCSIQASPASPT